MSVYRGKVAVVTGAGSGIGRALALQLAREGARLALSDVNLAAVEETARLCTPADVEVWQVDVSKRDEVFSFAAAAKAHFGSVDYLFNNAGVTIAGTIDQCSIEEFEWQIGINLWGVIYGVKAFLPFMLEQRSGHIVNLSSILGLVGARLQGAYNVTKFGVRGLTECLWSELKGTGVKATTVHPGGIRTNIGGTARIASNAGETERQAMEMIDKNLLVTPPDRCARDILAGVAKGKRKILTGYKSRTIDLLSRLLPARYTEILALYGL